MTTYDTCRPQRDQPSGQPVMKCIIILYCYLDSLVTAAGKSFSGIVKDNNDLGRPTKTELDAPS